MEEKNKTPSSAKEARELKEKYYFTGRPCINGHIDLRRTVNGTCKSCLSNFSKAIYKKNRDAYLNAAKKRYQEKTEELKEYARIYRKNNKDKINKRTLKRLREDKDFKASYILRRYLRKISSLAKGDRSKSISILDLYYSPSEFAAHIERQFQKGMRWDNHGEWHIDHITPIAEYIKRGVTDPNVVNCLSNLRPVWAKDNLTKGDKVSFLL